MRRTRGQLHAKPCCQAIEVQDTPTSQLPAAAGSSLGMGGQQRGVGQARILPLSEQLLSSAVVAQTLPLKHGGSLGRWAKREPNIRGCTGELGPVPGQLHACRMQGTCDQGMGMQPLGPLSHALQNKSK